ncbi:Transposon Ty3-I Gag-Pol poly [Brachionus plicatilis]|uniref:Transposon Ty3-I Gag-Pol poly n=1 Tax=Brachionus plicatilis TaxID=10195 RepID=A0A3M7SJC3_BRAPC|nr:Transposon Ty3-I Gag-Pol poly [Brachionus plicatilis]
MSGLKSFGTTNNFFNTPMFSRRTLSNAPSSKRKPSVCWAFTFSIREVSTGVEIEINGKVSECLIGTGAFTSFISFDYFNSYYISKFTEIRDLNRKKWITANGTPLEVVGETELELKIGHKKFTNKFVIGKNLSHDVIIGVNFLRKHKFKIDFETNLLISSEGKVKIKSNRPTICQLILSKNTFTIEPFSNVTYRFKPESPIHGLNAIVECQGRFKVSESIVNTDEEIEILLENLTPIKQTIRPFTILGKLSVCSIVEEIKNQKDLCKFISNDLKVEEICTIRASPNQEPWKPSSVMEFKDQSLSSNQKDSLKTLIDKYYGNCEFDENPIENFKWLSTVLTTGYYCRLQKTKIRYKNKIFNEICNADNLECNLGDSILIWNKEIVNSCPYRLFSSLKLNLPYDNILSNPSGNQMFKVINIQYCTKV